MDIKPSITENWYIIFTKSKYKKGVMRWIKRDFSHVYAMKKSEGEQFWMIINPLVSHTDVSMLTLDEFPHPRCWAGSDAIILPVTARIGGKPRWTLCVFNCVEVVKGLLGIRSFWTWTPWQLYKYLRRQEHG